jgi:hypothetical protein
VGSPQEGNLNHQSTKSTKRNPITSANLCVLGALVVNLEPSLRPLLQILRDVTDQGHCFGDVIVHHRVQFILDLIEPRDLHR